MGFELHQPLWNLHKNFTHQESLEIQGEGGLKKVELINYQESDNKVHLINDVELETDKQVKQGR